MAGGVGVECPFSGKGLWLGVSSNFSRGKYVVSSSRWAVWSVAPGIVVMCHVRGHGGSFIKHSPGARLTRQHA